MISPCSINRHFDVKDRSDKESAKLFSVPDFVGDACKAIASRIRGAVAGVRFDDFHKVSKFLAVWYVEFTVGFNHVMWKGNKCSMVLVQMVW